MGHRVFPFALNGLVAAQQGLAFLVVIQLDIYLEALQFIADLIHSRLEDKVWNQFL